MTVHVLFFSVLRDVTGCAEMSWPDAPATLGELLEGMFDRWPKLRAWDRSLLLAVDHHYARRDAALRDGCEVAVMPPVQGG